MESTNCPFEAVQNSLPLREGAPATDATCLLALALVRMICKKEMREKMSHIDHGCRGERGLGGVEKKR